MEAGDAFLELDGFSGPLAFRAPGAVHVARTLAEVRPVLEAASRAGAEGRWAAGFVAYDAAPAFDPALRVPGAAGPGPLAWFAEYERPAEPDTFAEGEASLGPLTPDEDAAAHAAAVARIREGIGRGDFYQVNHTFRLRGPFRGDPLALYRRLRAAQGGGLGACLHTGDRAIVSASPELFLALRGRDVAMRPMKGTAPRGRWLEEDARAAEVLAASAKDRAENVMIVDLVRNDLGRVAEPGSVRVTRRFEVERYRTVLQLTSTVEGRLAPGHGLVDLVAATFPCGSVTGAPKVAAMARIAAEERSARGVYCGAIGVVAPGGDACFNVAIRTVELALAAAKPPSGQGKLVSGTAGSRVSGTGGSSVSGTATAGVGGGITWDSTAAGEHAEALAKAAFLTAPPRPPSLLETLRLEQGRYPLLAGHLARLEASARHLGVPLDLAEVQAALARAATPGGDARVRLVVAGRGAVEVERAPLPPRVDAALPVALAAAPVSRRDHRLFHKTTDRAPYDAARAARPDAFDVLLFNEEGEATEFTIGNLVAELELPGGGVECVTPPRDAGLLAGVQRAALLARGEVVERTVRVADLGRARRLWLVNALRGRVPVTLQDADPPARARE
ncbi:MAG: chorismate-binding protein [Anaeromyxobacter sp.]